MAEYPYNRAPTRPVHGDEYDSASRLDDVAVELTTNGQEHERFRDEAAPTARNRGPRPAEITWIEKEINHGTDD